MFFHHAVSVSSHHTQHVSLPQVPKYACIGVMHIGALYLDWAGMLWLQCASVKSVPSDEAVIDELGCAGCSSSADDVL